MFNKIICLQAMTLPKWVICSIRPSPPSVILFSLPLVTRSPPMSSYKSALSPRSKPLRLLPNSARHHVAQTSSITCPLFPKPFQVFFWKKFFEFFFLEKFLKHIFPSLIVDSNHANPGSPCQRDERRRNVLYESSSKRVQRKKRGSC